VSCCFHAIIIAGEKESDLHRTTMHQSEVAAENGSPPSWNENVWSRILNCMHVSRHPETYS
jgi:hypothetical protein